MRKALPGRAKAPKARTSGQSLSAADNHSLHAQTAKTAKLSRSTDEPGEVMTGNQGVKISDDQNSLKAGGRGPTLLEDFHRREKITHFDHERIPERVVHARGAAAHGVFQNTASVEDIPVIGPLAGPVPVPLN
jgi:catalase